MSAIRAGMSRVLAVALVAVPMGCSVPTLQEARDEVEHGLARRFQTVMPLTEDPATVIHGMLSDGILDADEAVRVAVANNKRLRSILEDLNIARAEIWRASLPPNPVMGAEVQFIESGGGDLLELSVAQSIIDILLTRIAHQ